MDKLFEAAKYYSKNFEGRRFHLIAGKNKNLLEFDIVFSPTNFKHLVGLHKLKDLPIYSRPSAIIYRQILDNKTTFNDISKSAYLSEVMDRLDIFNQMKGVLSKESLMLKALHGQFKGITADFLLSKKSESDAYVHLFLKNDKDGLTIPVTFFKHKDDEYLRIHGGRWKVLSIEEVKDNPKRIEQPQESSNQEHQPSEQTHNDVAEKPQENGGNSLDLVAITMDQCGNKIDQEMAQAAQAKNTQKEVAPQQVKQAQQPQQARQVEQYRQIGKVKQKSKTNNGASSKR